jgi:hypothetical protein
MRSRMRETEEAKLLGMVGGHTVVIKISLYKILYIIYYNIYKY